MEGKVLGIGNALVDILVKIPNENILQEFGLTRGSMRLVNSQQFMDIYNSIVDLNPSIVSGGSVANTIGGLANLGIQTTMVGKIGDNEFGKILIDDITKSGVEAHLLTTSDSFTGSCISLISPDSERTLATCLGASADLSVADINPDIFKGYTHFYTEGYLVQNHSLIESILRMSHENGLITCLDLASYNIAEEDHDFIEDLVRKYVNVVFANEEEATTFTGKEDLEALNDIAEMADTVVLKQGCRGSLVKYQGKTVRVGTTRVKTIDTTGAGDLYSAGFIFGMINGMDAEHCAIAGAIVSGNVIEVIGTKMDIRRWSKIRSQLQKL